MIGLVKKQGLKWLVAACPFLWAVSLVLFLFAYNVGEVRAFDLLYPILAVICVTFILYLVVRLVTRRQDKAVVIVSFSMFWFFVYGYIDDVWQGLNGAIFDWHPTLVSMALWGSVIVAVAIIVLRMRRNLDTFVKYLALAGLVFVAISVVNIGLYAVRATTTDGVIFEDVVEQNDTLTEAQMGSPDIYYIILDRYSRADILEEYYGFDNSEFIGYLEDKGFIVVSESRCNYGLTIHSLASCLNMEYIGYLTDIYGENSQEISVISKMIANNEVERFLVAKGYESVYIVANPVDTGMERSQSNILKSQVRLDLSYFASYLLQRCPLRPWINRQATWDYRDGINFCFCALESMPNYCDRPVFTVTHVMCPHPIWVDGQMTYPFDHNGDVPEGSGSYVEQTMFVNKKVEHMIDEILRKSSIPPIIILQSDTGLDFSLGTTAYNILNAYYLPSGDNGMLYPSISPVNTFRMVLDVYFGADYELLPDETYSTTYKQPFKMDAVDFSDE